MKNGKRNLLTGKPSNVVLADAVRVALRPVLTSASTAQARKAFYTAGLEASALAWSTGYPLLVLPTLIEEKVQETQLRLEKQSQILLQTEKMYSLTA